MKDTFARRGIVVPHVQIDPAGYANSKGDHIIWGDPG